MQKVILYIQPQLRNTTTEQDFVRVDLMEEELVTLSQVIQDAKEPDKIFTDYSRQFNLAASKRNNKIFKHWYNPDILGFDQQIMCNARIELNHLPFKYGKIRLEEAVIRNGEISFYKVTFFGNTVSLKDIIKEDELTALTWLNNFNVTQTDANIKTGLTAGLDYTVDSVSYTDAVIYPLITHTQSYIMDDANNDSNGMNISRANTANLSQRGVLPEDLKPAIKATLIIKAIEERYGLTFVDNEFLDSTPMDNLYLWLHRDKGKIQAPNSIEIKDSVSLFTCDTTRQSGPSSACTHFASGSPPFGSGTMGGVYIVTDNFTGNRPEGFFFEITIAPESAYTSVVYTIEIVDDLTGQVLTTLQDVSGQQSLSYGLGYSFINDLEIGQTLNLYARIKSGETFSFDSEIVNEHYVYNASPPANYDVYRAVFTQDSILTTSSEAVILDQLPKMKIIDFLKGIFSMFNLTTFLEFNDDIVVRTLDEFYQQGESHDITKYVKTDEYKVTRTNPLKEIDFEYPEPKTILAKEFKNLNNRKYGELEYKSQFKDGGVYKITAPFEHMVFERLQDKTDSTFSTVQVGAFLDEKVEPTIGAPLLFYGILQTNQDQINFLKGTTRPDTFGALCTAGTPEAIDDYWIPSVCNELGTATTPPAYCLNFGSEINTYQLTDYSGDTNSLFQKYYENYITRIFNKKSRIFNFSAILPLKVLLNLTLDDTVIIGTREYTINKMTTKLQSGDTNFELLNEPSDPVQVAIEYDAESYCTTDSDPTPTVTPSGGTFTSS